MRRVKLLHSYTEGNPLAHKPLKPKKKPLQSKPLQTLRTSTSMKVPGNLSSLKPLSSLSKKHKQNDD
jgi:hypothetical protein